MTVTDEQAKELLDITIQQFEEAAQRFESAAAQLRAEKSKVESVRLGALVGDYASGVAFNRAMEMLCQDVLAGGVALQQITAAVERLKGNVQ